MFASCRLLDVNEFQAAGPAHENDRLHLAAAVRTARGGTSAAAVTKSARYDGHVDHTVGVVGANFRQTIEMEPTSVFRDELQSSSSDGHTAADYPLHIASSYL